MGRKNTLRKFQSIKAGDMSGDLVSAVTDIQFLDNVGIQLNFTGTPVGDFFVQVSIDYELDNVTNKVVNPGNWIDVQLPTGVPAPVATGVAGNIYIDLNQMSAPFIRVRYARTSGTGTLDAFLSAKQI